MQIIVIDDNFLFRELIKSEVRALGGDVKVDFEFYTSNNGIEGLGYVFVTKPQLIIIDTTLPRYSGRELLDYIASNKGLSHIPVILLSEDEHADLPSNFIVVNKNGGRFSQRFAEALRGRFRFLLPQTRVMSGLANSILRLANRSDRLFKHNYKNPLLRFVNNLVALVLMLGANLLFSVHSIQQKQVVDADIAQAQANLYNYRVRVYPTVATFFLALVLLTLQTALFVAGGVTIFNSRISSVFALAQSDEIILDNSNADYQRDRIELVSGKLQVRPNVQNKSTDAKDSSKEAD